MRTGRSAGSGRETEALLVEHPEMLMGSEVLLAVNGTAVAGLGREEVERALAETAAEEIVVKVRDFPTFFALW